MAKVALRDPAAKLRVHTNAIALGMMALALGPEVNDCIEADTQIEGALVPNPKGVEMRQYEGGGPFVAFQTAVKRVKIQLSTTPVEEIARRMDEEKITIVLKGLPLPPVGHPLRKALRILLRERKWTARERKYMRLSHGVEDRSDGQDAVMRKTHEKEGETP
jgi:hypothetical protein